jgi:hypothetical protein
MHATNGAQEEDSGWKIRLHTDVSVLGRESVRKLTRTDGGTESVEGVLPAERREVRYRRCGLVTKFHTRQASRR